MRKFWTIQIVLLLLAFQVSYGRDQKERETVSLSGKWAFCADQSKAGEAENWAVNGIPEKLKRTVTVPHAWNAEKGMSKYWGLCWYEREFQIKKDRSRIYRIKFESVYHDARIYINGKMAGEHAGSGYTVFFVDVTPFIKEGKNRVAVRVDNSPSRSSIPYMKSYDWANDGGICRNVSLVTTSREALRNIKVTAKPEGSGGTAKLNISFLDTNTAHLKGLVLRAVVTEENQLTKNKVFEGKLEGKTAEGSLLASLEFGKITKWHFDNPALYKIKVSVFINGIRKDSYETVFGFRTIEANKERYILNGEPVRLMGVEWMPGSTLESGMAEKKSVMEKNLSLMKNANCIFTRFHWQQDEHVLDWCDRHGMLVQEEIPYWGPETRLTDTLLAKGMQQIDEMTEAHFNHPSIILWGLGNELSSHDKTNIEGLKKLDARIRKIDDSRLTSYVSNCLGWGFPSHGKELPDASGLFDILMFNEYYSTWYNKSIDSVSAALDRIHKEYPDKAMTISEWGLCEPVHKGGDARRADEMARQIAIYGSKHYIAGAIYFCLNDYRTHLGEDSSFSYPQRVHGVCDIKLNPKPSYDILKKISSPIEIVKIIQNNDGCSLILRGKTGLPSYTVRNYKIESGGETLTIDELKPGEEREFKLKTRGRGIRIKRPTGFEVAHIKSE